MSLRETIARILGRHERPAAATVIPPAGTRIACETGPPPPLDGPLTVRRTVRLTLADGRTADVEAIATYAAGDDGELQPIGLVYEPLSWFKAEKHER